ncbi:hypothetical protein Tco_0888345 [Tanacetum coccineum]
MSSSNYPTSDIEDAFSSNFPNCTPTSPNYFPASPRNISPDSSDNLSKYLLASLAISPFHDNPYMKAYNANKPPIPPQVSIDPLPVLPPSLIFPLSPMLNSQNFFPPKEIPPPKETKTPIESPICIEKMKERFVIDWIIMSKDFDKVKTKLKEARYRRSIWDRETRFLLFALGFLI